MPDKKGSKIEGVPVNSLSEMVSRLIELNELWKDKGTDSGVTLWFRGQANHNWGLTPSIYRMVGLDAEVYDIHKEQKRLIFEFVNRKRHLIHKFQPAPNLIPSIDDYCQWLSILQHYNYTTCFLDFSEQLIPAIMFAIERFMKNISSSAKNSPCVWVLDPLKLNKIIAGNIGDLFSAGSENYIPTIEQLKDSTTFIPSRIAVFSSLLSDRIQAQAGSFVTFPLSTFHHATTKPTFGEFSLDAHDDAEFFLEKWVITNPDRLRLEIKLIGSKYADMFPGLEG